MCLLVVLSGAMPEDHELYYGFTRFAIELNELDMEQSRFLPPTDTHTEPSNRHQHTRPMNLTDQMAAGQDDKGCLSTSPRAQRDWGRRWPRWDLPPPGNQRLRTVTETTLTGLSSPQGAGRCCVIPFPPSRFIGQA